MSTVLKMIKERKRIIIYTSFNIMSVLFGLIVDVIIVRRMIQEEFGFYSIVISTIGLSLSLFYNWNSSIITYFGGEEYTHTKSVYSINNLRTKLISYASMVFLLFVVGNYFLQIVELDMLLSLSLITIVGLRVLRDNTKRYLMVLKEKNLSGSMLFATKFVTLIALLVYGSATSAQNILFVVIIGELVSIVYYLYARIKYPKIKDEYQFETDLITKFCLWQMIGFFGLYLINYGDNFVIYAILGETQVAIYYVAYKLFFVLSEFAFTISSFFSPDIVSAVAKKDVKEINNVYYKERFIVLGVVLVGHIVLFIGANLLITTLYGSAYSLSVSIFRVLIIGSFIRYIVSFYNILLNSLYKVKLMQLANIARGALNIGLSIVFVYMFGVIGAAYATVLAIAIHSIYITYISEKELKRIRS